MMATRDDVYTAIRNADAAGDTASVQKLAAYLQTMPADNAAPAPAAPRYTSILPDSANAVATGANQGFLRLMGLPADAAANVWELGKAGLGAAYLAMTPRDADHRLPAALEPNKREDMVGTGDWLIKKAAQASPGTVLAQNPAYDNGYLQTAGSGLSMVANPSSWPEAAMQLGTGVAGSVASKAAVDATGNPAAGVIGALAPHGVTQAVTAATKAAVRGGEAGRQAMAQRVSDLQAAGIDNPTLGLASGNPFISGVENLVAKTPGGVGIMRDARQGIVNDLERKVISSADLASTNRGTDKAGAAITGGINLFKDAGKAKQGNDQGTGLYDKLDNFIPPQTPTDVSRTDAALKGLTATIPGAPNVSQQFINSKIAGIKQGFDVDTGNVASGPSSTQTVPMLGAPAMRTNAMGLQVPAGPVVGTTAGTIVPRGAIAPPPVEPGMRSIFGPAAPTFPAAPNGPIRTSSPILGAAPTRINGMGLEVPAGNLIGTRTDVIPPKPGRSGPFSGLGVQDDSPPTLPFQAVKQLRTSVGDAMGDNTLMPDVPTRQYSRLYAGLSGDIQNAATAAGPDATRAFNRANDYTRALVGDDGRLQKVAPIVNQNSPESVYKALNATLGDNASTSTFQAVKKSLPEGARGDFAGTVIERLGKATPGNQDSLSETWSPETFLTNWNKMAPKARDELLSGFPNSDQVRSDVQKVADATSLLRTNSKMFANPSGTAENASARATLGAIGIGGAGAMTGLVSPWIPAAAAGGVVGANLIARGATSKAVRDAMLRRDSPSGPLTWTDMLLANGVLPTEEKRAGQ